MKMYLQIVVQTKCHFSISVILIKIRGKFLKRIVKSCLKLGATETNFVKSHFNHGHWCWRRAPAPKTVNKIIQLKLTKDFVL